jgi:hypothetical protein
MRTTLDIDDDVLTAAKELAAAENKTAGRIISDLAWPKKLPIPIIDSGPTTSHGSTRSRSTENICLG